MFNQNIDKIFNLFFAGTKYIEYAFWTEHAPCPPHFSIKLKYKFYFQNPYEQKEK